MASPPILFKVSVPVQDLTVMTIDIGLRNYAICVERFDKVAVQECKTIEEVEKIGKIIHLDVIELPGSELPGTRDRVTHLALIEMFRDMKSILSSVNNVVIEQQLKKNPVAQKLEQATYTTLLILYPHIFPLEYPSTNKTKVYGLRFKEKKARKSWAVDNAIRIVTARGDGKTLEILQNTRKKDDMGDVISMMQAFKWWTVNQRKI